jgi:hypothetical protein
MKLMAVESERARIQKRTSVVAEDPTEGLGEKSVLKHEKICFRARKNV